MAHGQGEARIIAVMGSTGSGKSHYVKTKILKPKPSRLAVWDFKREYIGMAQTESVADMLDALASAKFSVAFLPSMDDKVRAKQFNLVCRAVLAAQRMTYVVEELAFVTKPGFAPSGWRMLTLTGRHDALTIVGTSQRPASIDKDFLGNCTLVHSGVLGYKADAIAVGDALRVPPEELMALPNWHWIERDRGPGEARRGGPRGARAQQG